MTMKLFFKHWVKYILSGLLPTGLEIILLYFFVEVFHFWYLISSTIAFIFGFVISFYLRKFWVFRDKDLSIIKKQIFLYSFVFVFNIFANLFIMYFVVEYFNLQYLLAQIVSNIFLGLFGFGFSRSFIFKYNC